MHSADAVLGILEFALFPGSAVWSDLSLSLVMQGSCSQPCDRGHGVGAGWRTIIH